jgi:SAM-dependent methyltransferase
MSDQSVRAAREQLPLVCYVVADMASVEFAPMSFDLVTAFYSLIHVPRDEHAAVLAGISCWLELGPGGIALLTMGAGDGGEGVSENWLGAPMYWSNWDAKGTSAWSPLTGYRFWMPGRRRRRRMADSYPSSG